MSNLTAKICIQLFVVFGLSGCVTLSGTYVITATDAEGREVASNVQMMAEGRGIYSARNALCANNPGGVVHIKDIQTGKELQSESPYRCKGAKH